jgi:hypothetical protein
LNNPPKITGVEEISFPAKIAETEIILEMTRFDAEQLAEALVRHLEATLLLGALISSEPTL